MAYAIGAQQMTYPLSQLKGPVRALFSDVDGTLTTGGRVEASTYRALEQLDQFGVPVVLVTGRPAGWGHAMMSLMPVAAVVAENGGVTFVRREGKLEKIYGVPAAMLPEWRRRMHAAAVDLMNEVPGARLSVDSKYREVDLAIDWNEEASLSPEDAEHVTEFLSRQGFAAVRSSVHVNFGPPTFTKLTACKRVVALVLGGDPSDLSPYVFVGDALNDAPMFGGFSRSVGVANVKNWWDQLADRPRFVTPSAEGAGLRELIQQIIEIHKQSL
jgi:HAD superfamily hydrolase (TIGR01484 family)